MSSIKNLLPKHDENTRFVMVDTLRNICNAVRIRRNTNETFKIGYLSNIIDNTDFGIFFPGGYGGAAFDQGTNLYQKYRENTTFMAPIIGENVINCQEAFANCPNLFGPPLMKSDICTSMYKTFYCCSNLYGEVEIGKSVTNLSMAFSNCYNLYGDVPDIRKVTNASKSFSNCYNITGNVLLGENVKDISNAFEYCESLNGVLSCAGNNYITNMKSAFQNCAKLMGSPISGPNVTDMGSCYYGCTNLTGHPLCGPKVTSLYRTYYDCVNITGSPIIGEAVTNAYAAYYNCSNLRGTPNILSKTVTDLSNAFYNCTNMTGTVEVPSSVKKLINTFYNCTNLGAVIIKGTNATELNETMQHGCFIRDNYSKRLNIIYSNKSVYEVGRSESVVGCELTADMALPEPFNILLPYTYSNGKWYGYQNISVNRVSYNEERNIYVYCVV